MMGKEPGTNGHWIHLAVDQFERPLTGYVAHLTGDAERARDIVQEAFLRLCRQEPSRVQPHLAEWLYTVCRNQALDARRKEKRMSLLTQAQAESQTSLDADPFQSLEQKDSAAGVLKLLAGLPENQREVIRLKFQQGLSYRQISKITNLSVSNVGFLIHTGLKTIRSWHGLPARGS